MLCLADLCVKRPMVYKTVHASQLTASQQADRRPDGQTYKQLAGKQTGTCKI